MRIKRGVLAGALALMGLVCPVSGVAASDFNTITNDTFWKTVDGEYIFSQGGGIFRFPDPVTGEEHYYWYGVRYKEAVDYAPSPLKGSNSNMTNFQAVTCYRSDDLVNWTYVCDVMDGDTFASIGFPAWIGRLGVAYIPEAACYALLVQTEYMDATGYVKRVGVYTSQTATGRYEVNNLIDMTAMTGQPNTGDQTVFTDLDGQSYLCYSYGKGRGKIYLSKIGVLPDGKIGLLDCNKVYQGSGREGDCMFRYKDKYYICASDLYGWNASNLYYLEADEIYGPYKPVNSMLKMPGAEMDYGHVTQTGFFVTVRGTKEETVINCGDRWAGFAGNGNGFNQWCPITFDEGTPLFHSLGQWSLNVETGEWKVGADNNYIKNFSFEADRVNIPSGNKPKQTYIKGWSFDVVKGNKIEVGGADSPVLNAKNNTTDRETVMGNFSLNVSDKADFARRVYQKIESTDRVPLLDGKYRMTCKAIGGADFNELYMYVESGGAKVKADITPSDNWATVVIEDVPVRGGVAEVGIYADGKANAQVRIDDMELVLTERSGIEDIVLGGVDEANAEKEYYTVTGARVSSPVKGINIVRYRSGDKTAVKKIVVN